MHSKSYRLAQSSLLGRLFSYSLLSFLIDTCRYWANAGLVLEPRLSSKWLINAAFMGTIVSQPPPLQTFFLHNSKLFQPLPPPINIVLENILPSPITKVHLSKGLQSPSGLVQHTAATLLSKCLIKLHSVLNIFRQAGSALEENETDGQWARRLRDIEREARCRVPEFQVIVAFSQAKNDGTDQLKAALLNESSQRLLWLYHKCLPSLIEEARFDFGKSLTQVVGFHSENEDGETLETTKKLRTVEHLHLLRLLKDSNQFVWNVKPSEFQLSLLGNWYLSPFRWSHPYISLHSSQIGHYVRSTGHPVCSR